MAYAWPNREFFKSKLKELGGYQKVADKIGKSRGTVQNLRAGKRTLRNTLVEIAERLEVPLKAVIEPVNTRWLPLEPEKYISLTHAYFLDHDRKSSGKVKWWSETIKDWKYHKEKTMDGFGQKFDCTIVNQQRVCFRVKARLFNEFLFSFHAVSEKKIGGRLVSFTAAFSQRVDNVFCGFWAGINAFELDQAIFRMFLASEPLPKDKLIELSKLFPIEVNVGKVREFGF